MLYYEVHCTEHIHSDSKSLDNDFQPCIDLL